MVYVSLYTAGHDASRDAAGQLPPPGTLKLQVVSLQTVSSSLYVDATIL